MDDPGRWSALPDGPLHNRQGPPPLAAWNGEKILVLRREQMERSSAASFDPCDDAWAEVSLPAELGRFGNVFQNLGGRLFVTHVLPPNDTAGLLSNVELTSLSPAPDALMASPIAAVGDLMVVADYEASWVDFAHTRLVAVDGSTQPVGGHVPPRRTQQGVTEVDDGVFLYGGWENPPGRHLGDAYLLSIPDATWMALPTEGAPAPRSPLVVEHVAEVVVVFGGRDQDGIRTDGGVFDLRARRWTPVTEEGAPAISDDSLVTVAGERVYVLGGHAACQGCVGEPIHTGGSYDPVANRWRPVALSRHVDTTWVRAHALDDGRLLLRHRDLKWLALYDPNADTWTEIDPGPVKNRVNAAIAWTGRRLFVWGGTLVGHVDEHQCENTPPMQGCDPVGPELSYPRGGAILAL